MVSALLPLLLSTAYLGDIDRSSNFGPDMEALGARPADVVLPQYGYYVPSMYYPPNWLELLRPQMSLSSVTLDKTTFKVTLDMHQFKPEEIEIKVKGRQILVSAKHVEKKEGASASASAQAVSRSYVVPDNVVLEEITSKLSSSGTLTIQAPVKEPPNPRPEEEARAVKIELAEEQTVEPHLNNEEQENQASSYPTTTSAPEEPTTNGLPPNNTAQ